MDWFGTRELLIILHKGRGGITITLLSECALIMREVTLLLANSDLLKQARYQVRRLHVKIAWYPANQMTSHRVTVRRPLSA